VATKTNIKLCVLPNERLPEGIPSGQADRMSVGAFCTANGGFQFLLLRSLYLMAIV
jgi:hypothetical protein